MNFLETILTKCQSISFRNHLLISLAIRLGLIIYGEIQDEIAEVPYTDIDYKVVTDGARHILQGSSPFKRHTYRYSPLLAMLLIPNLLIHKCFGKLIFSLFDILTGIMIEKVVYNEFKNEFFESIKKKKNDEKEDDKDKIEVSQDRSKADKNKTKENTKIIEKIQNFQLPVAYSNSAKYAALFWLYNPLSMVIATRGNGDSITSFFVLTTIYFIHKINSQNKYAFLTGLCLGISIHLRIYPIIYSLPIFLVLSNNSPLPFYQHFFFERFLIRMAFVIKTIISPNMCQKYLIFGTLLSLGTLTMFFYLLYGIEYLQEAYIYHFTRTDIRHNFSLYFLMQYLGMDFKLGFWGQILKVLPRLLLLLHLSITFGWKRSTLSFCLFAQTFIMVTYNPVITSQYFVWYLSLLPLYLKNFVPLKSHLLDIFGWLLAQGLWLFSAYRLEFESDNTFITIGIRCGLMFMAHSFILIQLIYDFKFIENIL